MIDFPWLPPTHPHIDRQKAPKAYSEAGSVQRRPAKVVSIGLNGTAMAGEDRKDNGTMEAWREWYRAEKAKVFVASLIWFYFIYDGNGGEIGQGSYIEHIEYNIKRSFFSVVYYWQEGRLISNK